MPQTTIFDDFLKKGLLPSLGSTTKEVYDYLINSIKSITDNLEENNEKIIQYTLVAFDNDINEDEPILEDVETYISNEWQLMGNHFGEKKPFVLYRAVILQALENLVEKDPTYGTIIWFAVIDIFPFLNIPQNELPILQAFLHRLGDIAEEKATKEWTIDKEEVKIKIPTLSLTLNKVSVEVDSNSLKEYMIAASGPHGQDGEPRTNPNPHWPNNGQNWSYQFAPRVADGITKVINSALIKQSEGIDKNTGILQKSLNDYVAQLSKNIQTALTDSVQSSVAVERRSQLLWWKETLYSKKLRKTYRKLSKFQCTIAMSVDLYHLLPSFFPISVDFILRETFCQIHGQNNDNIKIIDFLKEVDSSKNAEFLKQFFPQKSNPEGRIDLVSYLNKIIYGKISIETETLQRLGIAPDKEINYEDISVWILHCLSAHHLTEE